MRDESAVTVDDKGIETIILVVDVLQRAAMIGVGIDDLQLIGKPFQRHIGTENAHNRVFLIVEGHDKRADIVVLSDIIEIRIRPEAVLRLLALGVPFFVQIVMIGRADVPRMFVCILVHIDLEPSSVLGEVFRLESDKVALDIVVQLNLVLQRAHHHLGGVQPIEHLVDDIPGTQLLGGENPFQFLIDQVHDRLVPFVCRVLDNAEGDPNDDAGYDYQCCQQSQHHPPGQPVGERLVILSHSTR